MIGVVAKKSTKSREQPRGFTGTPHMWSPVQRSVSSGSGCDLPSPPPTQAPPMPTEKTPRRYTEVQSPSSHRQIHVGENSRQRTSQLRRNTETMERSPRQMHPGSTEVEQVRKINRATASQEKEREVVVTPLKSEFLELQVVV